MAVRGTEDTSGDANGGAVRAALLALATGAWRQAMLAVAAQLDLFALLGSRAADLEEVSYSLGTRRDATRLFLAACEGLRLVEQRDDAYLLAPLGRAVLEAPGRSLADWANTTCDVAFRDALLAALVGDPPRGDVAPCGRAGRSRRNAAYREHARRNAASLAAASRPTDEVVLSGLQGAAADALAANLPLPADGLILEVGGDAIYARALLARVPHLHAALVEPDPLAWDVAQGRLPLEHSPMPVAVLPELAALGERRARLAVVAQSLHNGGAATLRRQLAALRHYLAADAPVAVVGPFLASGAGPRPLAPLLALAWLAAGRTVWCPTSEIVVDHLRASGFAVARTVVLPEPNVAVVGQLQPAAQNVGTPAS